jgi:hypothetical protein
VNHDVTAMVTIYLQALNQDLRPEGFRAFIPAGRSPSTGMVITYKNNALNYF